jgi:hypothetical protein
MQKVKDDMHFFQRNKTAVSQLATQGAFNSVYGKEAGVQERSQKKQEEKKKETGTSQPVDRHEGNFQTKWSKRAGKPNPDSKKIHAMNTKSI